MLENTLKIIEQKIVKNNILDKREVELLVDFLRNYEVGQYIYPGMIISKLKITSAIAYNVLTNMEDSGFISKSYEEYCSRCGKVNGNIYDSFGDIPEKMYCKFCGDRLDPINDTVVIYKVEVI